MGLHSIDIAVVLVYAAVLMVLAQWVSRDKAGHHKDT